MYLTVCLLNHKKLYTSFELHDFAVNYIMQHVINVHTLDKSLLNPKKMPILTMLNTLHCIAAYSQTRILALNLFKKMKTKKYLWCRNIIKVTVTIF